MNRSQSAGVMIHDKDISSEDQPAKGGTYHAAGRARDMFAGLARDAPQFRNCRAGGLWSVSAPEVIQCVPGRFEQ